MKKYWNFIIPTLIVLIVLVSIAIIQSNKVYVGPEKECEVVLKNEGENKIEIVFLTNQVSKNKIREYIDFLLDSTPFNSSKEKFDFFYAGEANCEIIQENILFCYSKYLVRQAAICPDDYIVVLSDKPENIRSSAYLNVVSVNINNPKSVLLHEIGHVFANLADEYVPSPLPHGAENCVENCENFEVSEGCFQGCSDAEYYRSSEASVMRTLSTTYYKKLNSIIIDRILEKYE